MKLSQELVDAVVASVRKALDREEAKRRKEEQDWRLHNTELLIRNYCKLKVHCELAKDFICDEEALDMRKLTMESLLKCRVRVVKIMEEVDRCLKAYKRFCQVGREEEQRRWRVLEARYLEPSRLTVDEIAELENISRRTVYEDLDRAFADLNAFLWGMDL